MSPQGVMIRKEATYSPGLSPINLLAPELYFLNFSTLFT